MTYDYDGFYESRWGMTRPSWVGADVDTSLELFKEKLRARGYTHYSIRLIGRVGGWEVRIRKDRSGGLSDVKKFTTWMTDLSEHLLGITSGNQV